MSNITDEPSVKIGMSWIDKLVLMHSEFESPKSFWFWSGLAAISAIVKDNIYLDRFAYKLYPNIYVMLYADSGMKKGPPVALAKDLVSKQKVTRVISGRSSIQGILKELGTAYTAPGGKVITSATAFIVASEFSSSLVADPFAMSILTDLYDRHYHEDQFKSLLKMESFTLKDPTITLLVATNEAHFAEFVEAKDVHGGFIGRMFVIAESEVSTLNPLIKKPKIMPDREALSGYLGELAKLKGEIKTLENTHAGERYEEWYMEFYEHIRAHKIKDETGTMQRFGDSVLKVAILLSLADTPELVIHDSTMELAIATCEKLLGNVRKATMGKKGKNPYATIKAMIIEELLIKRENHQISREMLAKKLWMHVNTSELDEIMGSFEESKMIISKRIGSQVVYEMPAKYVKELLDYYRGKNAK
jgi:hypothetical protein